MDYTVDYVLRQIMPMVLAYLPKLLMALLVLVVGWPLIGFFVHLLNKALKKQDIDISLRPFLSSIASISLKIMLLITVASMLGLEMTSFIAVLGAATLAIGLSLQGSLSNLAGGFLILFFKPFSVGDVIESGNHIGRVEAIKVFSTTLVTADNKVIILPNGPLANSDIINYTLKDTRRVDLVFGIGYEDCIKKAKSILEGLAKSDSRVLADPEPLVAVSELADSSVNFVFRVWVNSADYWGVYFDMVEKAKLKFDQEGINMPYPQMDVHLKKE